MCSIRKEDKKSRWRQWWYQHPCCFLPGWGDGHRFPKGQLSHSQTTEMKLPSSLQVSSNTGWTSQAVPAWLFPFQHQNCPFAVPLLPWSLLVLFWSSTWAQSLSPPPSGLREGTSRFPEPLSRLLKSSRDVTGFPPLRQQPASIHLPLSPCL